MTINIDSNQALAIANLITLVGVIGSALLYGGTKYVLHQLEKRRTQPILENEPVEDYEAVQDDDHTILRTRPGQTHTCGLGARGVHFGVTGRGLTHCGGSYRVGQKGYRRCEKCRNAEDHRAGFVGKLSELSREDMDLHGQVRAERDQRKKAKAKAERAALPANGLLCIHCGEPLTGRQTKYCSSACGSAYRNGDSTVTMEQPSQNNPAPEMKIVSGGCEFCDNSGPVIELAGHRICLECLNALQTEGFKQQASAAPPVIPQQKVNQNDDVSTEAVN